MFQLLIFFMVTSNLSAFSFLTLQSGAPGSDDTSAGGAGSAAGGLLASGGNASVWVIGLSGIEIGGQVLGYDVLDPLVQALAQRQDQSGVLLVLTDSARVQDLANVLAALEQADIGTVRLAKTVQP